MLALSGLVASHVDLIWPPSRFQNPTGVPGAAASVFPTLLEAAGGCHNFACLWFNQGCQPGCAVCSDKAHMPVSPDVDTLEDACSEANMTTVPTLPASLRTYQDGPSGKDWTWRSPWRSPGHAPVASPCGLAGGGALPGSWLSDSLQEHIRSGAVSPPFVRRGFDGRDVPPGPRTSWRRGTAQEVAWSIFANKGGGYAYRLCPKSSAHDGALSEECFQSGHLKFASNLSWIQYGSNESSRTPIAAARTNVGTWPAGSTWTRSPIPPCANKDGSPVQDPPRCPAPMFPPPLPGLYGDGPGSCITWAIHGPVEGYHTLYDPFGASVYSGEPGCTKEVGLQLAQHFQFSIFDLVEVPAELPPGEYTLSFRLDAEQTPQVWAHCSDIDVVD